jgi:hypothetical protein
MLLLTSINDQIQIVTGVAGAIDVHATWVDTVPSTGAITPGRTNTAIITAATVSVAGSPAASTQRNVKTLHIRNKHATLNNDVTVRHSDGTAVCELFRRALAPGGEIEYTDQGGFINLRI